VQHIFKLKANLVFEFDVEKRDFIREMMKHVDETEFLFWGNPFEDLHKSDNKYLGIIKNDTFEIRRRRTRMERRRIYPSVLGKFIDEEGKLKIRVTINGVNSELQWFGIVYLTCFVFILITMNWLADFGPLMGMGLLLFFTAIFFGNIYRLQAEVQREKIEIERELNFIAGKL